jgi:hypothetical protein
MISIVVEYPLHAILVLLALLLRWHRSVSHRLARLHAWRVEGGSYRDRENQNERSASECQRSVKEMDNVRTGYVDAKYVRARRGSGNSFSFIGCSDAGKENNNPEVVCVVSALAGVTGYGSQQARYGVKLRRAWPSS